MFQIENTVTSIPDICVMKTPRLISSFVFGRIHLGESAANALNNMSPVKHPFCILPKSLTRRREGLTVSVVTGSILTRAWNGAG